MKKLDLKLGSIKEMLTKEQMKGITGGYDTGYCQYHCCTDQHENCTDYTTSSYSCGSYDDCGAHTDSVTCASGGPQHIYYICS